MSYWNICVKKKLFPLSRTIYLSYLIMKFQLRHRSWTLSDVCKITEKRMWDDYEMAVKWIQEWFKVWKVCEIIIDQFMNIIGCLETNNWDILANFEMNVKWAWDYWKMTLRIIWYDYMMTDLLNMIWMKDNYEIWDQITMRWLRYVYEMTMLWLWDDC